ncbi:hypothetical protein AB833_23340 [Chromatiales bacterium (ex Bugula neritina AB1)]|nr:hypothetical protein AB833_23340 [Chromatiales bacterium (ex Bugula neritina AB1)]
MKKEIRYIKDNRRSFLKGAVVAGGAAVVAPAVVVAAEEPLIDVDVSTADKGYEENDYIRNYYDRARF